MMFSAIFSRHSAFLFCPSPPSRTADRLAGGLGAIRGFRVRRFLEGVSLWLAMLLVLFVQPLYAEASVGEENTAGALHFVGDNGQWQKPALVLGSEFDVQVSGLLASTRLRRTFENTSDQWREGVFVFPLPAKASVYGLTMQVGERTIVGEVQPRQQARKAYARARDSGRQAATVEQQRPNLFTSRVANIPPGAQVQVELRYQQPVAYRNGVFELSVPTTLTPRYMPGEALAEPPQQWQQGWAMPTAQVPDANEISPFTVPGAAVSASSHRASVQVTLNAGMALSQVSSPTHALVKQQDGQAMSVQPQAGDIVMNRDFVLRWQPLAGQEPQAAVFHQHWQGEDYLLAMVVPGRAGNTGLPRELTFVIDTSGSMAGSSIRQARQALQRGLETLAPGDRFNVIRFDSQAHALFMQPVPATANNLARARRYVSDLQADGGTEMTQALTLALNGAGKRGVGQAEDDRARVRQVVFITDGAVGNESALYQQIRNQLGDHRLFTVGIGSAPNRYFMREAARWGRGSYTRVQDPADVAGPLATLFEAMQAPVLTDVAVHWPGAAGHETASFPARPGDLFQGEPLLQVVRGVPPAGELTLSGQLPGGHEWRKTLDLQQAAPGAGLARHWAREKIDSLMDEARVQAREPDKAKITELAITHSLVSPYTSFVAVDTLRARAPEQGLHKESIPTLLPAGGQAGMVRYPQTATSAPLLIALGLLGLILALAIRVLQKQVQP